MTSVKKATMDGMQNKKAVLGRCHAGFSTLMVPIRVEDTYLGCVFGDGFMITRTANAQKAQIKSTMASLFPSEDHLIHYIDSLPILDEREVDYLRRLVEIVVEEMIQTEFRLSNAQEQVSQLKSQLEDRFGYGNIIGKSAQMSEVYQLIERVADSQALVLIHGENGTGKELIAKALHYNSNRKDAPFLAINCAAFQTSLLESELFGHIKGSFTGAMGDKKGLFEAAENGTLFLDEIGEMPKDMQAKFLRVLQDGSFLPVGSTKVKKTSARIVCATNKNLLEMVAQQEFREDLYYRLNVIRINLPALRNRREDIPLLLEHFCQKSAQRNNKPHAKLSRQLTQLLLNYSWPGNIRELENELEKMIILTEDGGELDTTFVSEGILHQTSSDQTSKDSRPSQILKEYPGFNPDQSLKEIIASVEKSVITQGLEKTRWNKSELAKKLGISRSNLIHKVQKYKLE